MEKKTIIPQSKESLLWYRFGWLACLAISAFFMWAYLDGRLILYKVASILFLFLTIISPFLFKQFIYSIEADGKGIEKKYYKSTKRIQIDWENIISVEMSPMKIPLELRLIKSSEGKVIELSKATKGYKELIDLIRNNAKKVKQIEE